jgi:Flp pilus assembly protein TadD
MTNFHRSRSAWTSVLILAVMTTTLSCAAQIGSRINQAVSKIEVNDWHELTSNDFVLYSRGSQEDLESFAVDIARFIAVVERLVDAESPKSRARLVLVNGRARELFIPTERVLGFMGHTISGFSGFVRAGQYDPVVRSVLLHEYTHYLTLRNTRLRYPTWYTEGFAEFLGPIRTRGDTMEVGSRPPGRLEALRRRRQRQDPIDLAEIFAFQRGAGIPTPADLYPISWATVHYMNSTPDGQAMLLKMIDAQARGVEWKVAYSNAFSLSLEELATKVEQHAKTLSDGTPAAVLYLPIEALNVRTDWTIRALEPADTLLLLAEFAAQGVVYGSPEYNQTLAKSLFHRALQSRPNDSRLHAGLAAVLAQQSDFEASDSHLAVFHQDPDPSEAAIVHAAHAIRLFAASLSTDELEDERKKANKTAIQLYERALEIESKDPIALAGLGYSLVASDRFADAREPITRAQSLGEWNAELALDRGRVEAKTGFVKEAKLFWSEVVRLGTEEQSKEAAALIVLAEVNMSESASARLHEDIDSVERPNP